MFQASYTSTRELVHKYELTPGHNNPERLADSKGATAYSNRGHSLRQNTSLIKRETSLDYWLST